MGLRDGDHANAFVHDISDRVNSRMQLTSDGHRPYLEAIEDAFGGEIDYAMLIKLYGAERAGEARYSPARCVGCRGKNSSEST